MTHRLFKVDIRSQKEYLIQLGFKPVDDGSRWEKEIDCWWFKTRTISLYPNWEEQTFRVYSKLRMAMYQGFDVLVNNLKWSLK